MTNKLLTYVLMLLLSTGLLSCSSSDGSSSAPELAISEQPDALDNRCFSCTQTVTAGDTCGNEMITGGSSQLKFYQDGTILTVDMDGAFDLDGTYENGEAIASNDEASYFGPDCDASYTDIVFDATINKDIHFNIGFSGILSYDIYRSSESACDKYSSQKCEAVHTITCLKGCN